MVDKDKGDTAVVKDMADMNHHDSFENMTQTDIRENINTTKNKKNLRHP